MTIEKKDQATLEEILKAVIKCIEDVKELKDEVSDLDSKVDDFDNDKVSDLESRIDDLEGHDIDDIESRIDDLEDNKPESVDDFKSRIEKLEEQIKNIKAC